MEKHLKKEVMLAYMRIGHTAVPEVIELAAKDLSEYLAKYGKGMTEQDISLAFKRGCLYKTYGEFMTISVATCMMWIQGYIKQHPNKSELQRGYISQGFQIEEKSEHTKAVELEKRDKEWIAEAKAKYQKQGHYNDFGNIIYKALIRQKLLTVNDELIEKCISLVKQDEEREAKVKFAKFEIGKNGLSELINAIAERNEPEYKIKHKMVELWMRGEV